MQLEFRTLPHGQKPVPAPGEVWLVRAEPGTGGLAEAIQRRGLEALLRGDGEPGVFVVDPGVTGPTLDDMVAVGYARLLLAGRDLAGDGYRDLARYAAHLLGGYKPEGVPPEKSVAGVFYAVRNGTAPGGAGANLLLPEAADRFRRDWARLEDCLLKAAERGVNPFASSPVADDPEFAVERAFLAADLHRYPADVARGERWTVTLPGKPERFGGLLLRQPSSLLFKYWARADDKAPGGGGYTFLATKWGEETWVFTTDPTKSVPIAGLAACLQTREERRAPARANADPWYDGARHGYTLVASPKGGTVLSEGEVVRAVRGWAKAKRVVDPTPRRGWLVAAALLLVAGMAAGYPVLRDWLSRRPLSSADEKRMPGYMLSYSGNGWLGWGERPGAVKFRLGSGKKTKLNIEAPPWPGTVRLVFHSKAGGAPLVQMRSGEPPMREWVRYVSAHDPNRAAYRSAGTLSWKEKDEFVEVHNPGSKDYEGTYEVELLPATLHVLAIGASECTAISPLKGAADDVRELKAVMGRQKGRLFGDVKVNEIVGAACTREAIYEGFEWLKKAGPSDMCLVLFSGHGELDANGAYLFAPSDYKREAKGLRGVSGMEITRELCLVKCPVMVLIDTCHSGALPRQLGSLPDNHPGMHLYTSALAGKASEEKPTYGGHGPLVLAFLEAVGNERLFAPRKGRPAHDPADLASGHISWQDVHRYLDKRLDELTGKRQTMQHKTVEGKPYSELPIASLFGPAGD